MKLAFACPYYGPTIPLVGDSVRANMMNSQEVGHHWIDDYSVSGTQHRNACEAMVFKGGHDPRIDAVFWTEHDVILPPFAVNQLCETLEKVPEADVVTGIAFRRSEPYNPMIARLEDSLTPERYEEMKTHEEYNVRRAASLMSFEEMKKKLLMSLHTVDTTAGPFQVDTASMCCLLFRQSVFAKVWDVPDLFAIDPLGFFSIDNAFFLRLRDRGFKLFCDPRVLCGHLGDPEIIDWTKWRDHSTKVIEKHDLKQQEKLRKDGDSKSRIYGELTRLANKHGTDKGTLDHTPDSGWSGWIHNYCDFYQAMLEPLRQTAEKVLEIGVWHGASLKMWRDYFPNATVFGFDDWSCDAKPPVDESGRIVLIDGNQAKREDLARAMTTSGATHQGGRIGDYIVTADEAAPRSGFDLIVDDGGHTMEQQQVTLGFLFPYVRPGGWYILEDLHTSFLPDFGKDETGSNVTIKVIEALSEHRAVQSQYMTVEEMRYLDENVAECRIYGKKSLTSMIRKKRS